MFDDRREAGKRLIEKLIKFNFENAIVLAIPRGGVIVGNEIAKKFKIPFNVIVVRKLGYPTEPEFGFGAISENSTIYLNKKTLFNYKLSDEEKNKVINKEREELQRRIVLYRKGKGLPDLKKKTVFLVDDGLATGSSAKAAIMSVKKDNPKKIIFVSPVAGVDTYSEIERLVDEIVCLVKDKNLYAIGNYYKDFNQVTDDEVLDLLNN